MPTWNTSVKPIATYDGQLFVDDQMQSWKWDAAANAWIKLDGAKVQQTRDAQAYFNRRGPGTSLQSVMPGQLKNEWNQLYSKAFIAIVIDGVPTSYQSNLTFADLETWLWANVPVMGGLYMQNAQIQVYEVVMPQDDQRIIGYNTLYAMARGGDSYNRRKGRQDAGMPTKYQIANGFKAQPGGPYWTDAYVDPGQQFLNEFFGVVAAPSPDSDKIFWFGTNPGNLYRQPRQGAYVYPGVEQRMAYDVASGSYVVCGTYMNVGVPRFFGNYNGGTVRSLQDMGQLRGSQYFNQRRNGVLVYPMTNGDLRAFYIKPYGIDTFGIGFHIQNGWQVIAEYVYGTGIRDTSHRIVSAYEPWDDVAKLQRVWMNDLPFPRLSVCRGVDTPYLPRTMQFYALHVPTGLRTQAFPRRFALSSRECNVTMILLPQNVP